MKFWALSYSIPANPSRYRVAVWKALKELGAVYLQPAVAVVPQREGLREALLALTPRERALVLGRVLEEKSYEQLAEIFQAPPATLRKRYERAKHKLAKLLTEAQTEKP